MLVAGDVLVTLGAGDITGVSREVLAALETREAGRPG